MNSSILLDIRSLIGGEEEYSASDPFVIDLIIHINTVLRVLNQLGVGSNSFSITGSTETWSDFIGDASVTLDEIKTFVYLKVKMIFDPPTSGTMSQALTTAIDELTWRIVTKMDLDTYEKEQS